MKNLSKVLALALLLVPGAAQAEEWCHGDNEHIWTYASGQTNYTFQCDDVETPTITQASQYASDRCQLSWDNFASHYAFSGPVSILYSMPDNDQPGYSRWMYRCRACVHGHFPYLSPRPARLGPAEVGGIATGEVAGQVVSIVLHDAEGDRPYYLVDVLSKSEQVQVEVDANTGAAEVVKQGEGGVCRQ